MTAAEAIEALLRQRGAGTTICPSEAGRAVAADREKPEAWRDEMDAVHAAARRLADAGRVVLMQGGVTVAVPKGAYRIARGGGSTRS